MRKINIANPDFHYDDEDPEGFRVGMFRFGKQLGAEKTGTTVYELQPGEQICPYHYEYPEEEWLIVLQGRPTLRHPAARDARPWDVVFFPPGPDGAHSVRNDTERDRPRAHVLDEHVSGAAVYPDSDKIGICHRQRGRQCHRPAVQQGRVLRRRGLTTVFLQQSVGSPMPAARAA